MPKVALVYLIYDGLDYLAPLERELTGLGFKIEVCKIPYAGLFSRDYVSDLKRRLRKLSKEQFIIFSPASAELFMQEPDVSLLFFGYRSWFDDKKMRIIPHLWTPVGKPEQTEHLGWGAKPPLRIGFMGHSFASSGLANLIARMPLQIKRQIMRGSFLRFPRLMGFVNDVGISVKTINVFSRIEALQALKEKSVKYRSVELDIVSKGPFDGSTQNIDEYKNHLLRNTYVLCPRGMENYSYRMYEALAWGRIPIIIDTDVMLPKEIPWEAVSLKVSYESLDKMHEVILSDYESRSASEFIERQKLAMSTMKKLQSGQWFKELALELSVRVKSTSIYPS